MATLSRSVVEFNGVAAVMEDFAGVGPADLWIRRRSLEVLPPIAVMEAGFSRSSSIGLSDGNNLTINEEMEIEKQLKLLNKPAIKTIEDDGDIYDCVDINKQPAFDHPSLKNHKIQLSPSSYPKGLFDNNINVSSTNGTSIEIGLKNGNACPSGTVPIRRVSKDDLLRMRSTLKHKKMMHYSPSNYLNGDNEIYRTLAAYHTQYNHEDNEYYGASASINVYGLPQLTSTQFSSSFIWINALEHNLIKVGWTVDPNTYGDTKTRLTTAWTDPLTYNWWFIFGKEKTTIGYWPNKLFTTLRDHASWLNFGGVAGNLGRKEMPPMGSGHFSYEGLNRSCYFAWVRYIDSTTESHVLKEKDVSPNVDSKCYDVGKFKEIGGPQGNIFFFGGPGGC
ncbi:hypothetical protein J5N97_027816 [Dioscorea zingiberensis]|uniref:Neprosin PEP catalytic domain-containing protein n=1 Tax=Dioscorea zingiberensis TaxID=325984 RepID=A0A9D5BXZ3_9LILI|nr:hypothetical protein J5N97_027816 [Dioscorea zingiberensis]